MLQIHNNQITHINKGTSEVQAVILGVRQVLPYRKLMIADPYLNSPFCTELGYSSSYVQMLEKAGLEVFDLTEDDLGTIANCKEYSGRPLSEIISADPTYYPANFINDITNLSGTTTARIFYNKMNMTAFDATNLDTSTWTSMYNMFSGCRNLLAIDFSGKIHSKVTDTRSLFYRCTELKVAALKNCDFTGISNVTTSTSYSKSMFNGDNNLFDVDLSGIQYNSSTTGYYTFSNWFYMASNSNRTIKCREAVKTDLLKAPNNTTLNNGCTWETVQF